MLIRALHQSNPTHSFCDGLGDSAWTLVQKRSRVHSVHRGFKASERKDFVQSEMQPRETSVFRWTRAVLSEAENMERTQSKWRS
jgi:hypothetical protein